MFLTFQQFPRNNIPQLFKSPPEVLKNKKTNLITSEFIYYIC